MQVNIIKEFYETLKYVEDLISDRTTSNIQLQNVCDKIIGKNFLGVYSSNNCPSVHEMNINDCYITNTSSSYEQGIHWISAIKNKYNELVLFDSFGRDIHNLSKYFKHKHFICAIKRRLQSFKSYSCGAHCITFIIMYLKYQNHFLKYINS